MKFKFDEFGLIVQQDGDGGDSAARTGLFYFLMAMLGNNNPDAFAIALKSMQAPNFIRNPVKYNQTNDFSRDQENPIVIALGFFKSQESLLKQIFWNRVKRFGFYQNKDLSGPQDWGLFIRSLAFWEFYPYLLFSDLFLLINSLLICFWKARAPGKILTWLGKYWWGFVDEVPPNMNGVEQSRHEPDNVGDDINHCMMLMQAYLIYPTPISWLARKIYSKFRPIGVQFAWDWYFRPSSGANPFGELAAPMIKEIFK